MLVYSAAVASLQPSQPSPPLTLEIPSVSSWRRRACPLSSTFLVSFFLTLSLGSLGALVGTGVGSSTVPCAVLPVLFGRRRVGLVTSFIDPRRAAPVDVFRRRVGRDADLSIAWASECVCVGGGRPATVLVLIRIWSVEDGISAQGERSEEKGMQILLSQAR